MPIYLKIDGLNNPNGTVANIEVMSFSIAGPSSSESSSGAAAGRRRHGRFTVTKTVDEASPLLFNAVLTGKTFKDATVTFLPAVQNASTTGIYLKYTFEQLLPSAFDFGGSEQGSMLPTESLSIDFGAMSVDYVQQATASE